MDDSAHRAYLMGAVDTPAAVSKGFSKSPKQIMGLRLRYDIEELAVKWLS